MINPHTKTSSFFFSTHWGNLDFSTIFLQFHRTSEVDTGTNLLSLFSTKCWYKESYSNWKTNWISLIVCAIWKTQFSWGIFTLLVLSEAGNINPLLITWCGISYHPYTADMKTIAMWMYAFTNFCTPSFSLCLSAVAECSM